MQDPRFESPRGPDGRLIEPAVPAGRRRVVILLLLVAAVMGAVIIAGLERWLPAFRDWIASDPERATGRLTILLLVLAAFADLPLVIAGVYFWRLGQHTIDVGRFPPPGVILLRATTVLTGEAAVRRGRAAQVTAFVLFALGIGLVTALVGLVILLRS